MTQTQDLDELMGKAAREIAELAKTDVAAANVKSYNFSADLAECWPGDDRPRETRHFEAGLKAAEDCLRWRTELKKGPGPFSMAYWAKGMHELSLGRLAAAVEDFQKSLDLAVEGRGDAPDREVGPGGHWSVLLGEGYLRLARAANGDASAEAAFARCRGHLEAGVAAGGKEKDDLQFCLDQLLKVEGLLAARRIRGD